jgi:phage shock protein PspC (stress-responsive transcriptional regulator)
MSATTAPHHSALRRSLSEGILGGVCSGIARRLGVDAIWIRIAFVAATVAGGFGIPVYALGWALLPDDGTAPRRRRLLTRRSTVEVSLGAGFLVLAGLLTVRASGVAWFSDAVTWPVVLIAAGGVLIWRTSQSEAPPLPEPRTSSSTTPAADSGTFADAERAGWAAAVVSRTGLGVALVIAAALVFLQTTGALAPRATWRWRRSSSPSRSRSSSRRGSSAWPAR